MHRGVLRAGRRILDLHAADLDRPGRRPAGRLAHPVVRQSFLTSYAVHIGQRLRRSAEQALHDTGEEGRLLPVLRSQEETVVAAFEALVPDTIQKSSTVSNGAGWVAGQVAADLAVLDLEPSLDPARDAG